MKRLETGLFLRWGVAFATLAGGIVHLQQYLIGFRSIPVVGPSFLLNAIASILVAALLVASAHSLFSVAAAGIALGSIASLLLSRTTGLFGYVSSSYGVPEILVLLTETTVLLLVIALFLLPDRHSPSQPT